MIVDSKGTTMMDKGVNINTVGADSSSTSYYPDKGNYERNGKDVLRNDGVDSSAHSRGRYEIQEAGNNSRTSFGSDLTETSSTNNTGTGLGANSSKSASNDGKSDAYNAARPANSGTSKYDSNVKNTIIDDYRPDIEASGKSFESGDIVTINVVYLNVRTKPSADSRIIGVIPAGGKLWILDEKDDKWQRVKVVYYPKNKLKKEYDGWVHSGYLMAVNPGVDKWEDDL